MHILVPRDLVNLKSLFLKASFELMIGLYEDSVQTYSMFIDEHEESRHYQIEYHYLAYLRRGKAFFA